MAVEFPTDEQAARYGRFEGEPAQAELERFFFLDDADRELVAQRRSPHSRLGFAAQLGTVRFLGAFLSPDPLDMPWNVVDYLAGQLAIGCCPLASASEKSVPAHPADPAKLGEGQMG